MQVAGPNAPAIVNPLLQARRAIDVSELDPGELRFCQLLDQGEILDDALVAARRLPGGEVLVDINLHGGPRIVQRVLLALKTAGAQIVEASTHSAMNWPAKDLLEQEAIDLLPQAKTRAVAAWLVRAPGALAAAVQEIVGSISAGQRQAAEVALAGLIDRSVEARYLISGIRVVLIGEPNSGKSTLANALGEAERSIVSETPGTTRDWVEIPAAIDGVPVTVVDTAGIRHTHDPLEQESIRRAQAQAASADVILQVVDRSAPEPPAAGGAQDPDSPERYGHPVLRVWSKCDLPAHSTRRATGRGPAPLALSALTGEGLEALRHTILKAVGMDNWRCRAARLYTPRQQEICRGALAALAGQSDTHPSAVLKALFDKSTAFLNGTR